MTSSRTRVTRRFTVDADPAAAWKRLGDAARWPSRAHHFRKVELTPSWLGRLFARMYARNLDRAISRLQHELGLPLSGATVAPTHNA